MTTKIESFFCEEGKNTDYENIRLDDSLPPYPYDANEIREFIEQLWNQYQGYNDEIFLSKARNNDFLGRFWEMYLTCSLLELGINVEKREKSRQEGPDIKITEAKTTYWIEAITPSIGESPDIKKAFKFTEGVVHDVPDNETTHRLLKAIIEKTKDRKKYIKNGILSEYDQYIIAINSLKLGHVPDFEPPRLVRAVLGIGMPTVQFNLNGKIIDHGFARQECVKNLPKTFFQNREFYDGISALLYSDITPYMCTPPYFDNSKKFLADNCYLLHNPRAKNPLPNGFIKLAKEYWVNNDDKLQRKDWYKACRRNNKRDQPHKY